MAKCKLVRGILCRGPVDGYRTRPSQCTFIFFVAKTIEDLLKTGLSNIWSDMKSGRLRIWSSKEFREIYNYNFRLPTCAEYVKDVWIEL